MEPEIKEYVRILSQKLWFIIVVVVLACGITGTYAYLYSQPLYEANTKLIINTSNRVEGLSRPDSNEISSNIMLIDTYKEIILTPAIMEKVVTGNSNITFNVNELISRVKVSSSTGSQVMSISLRDTSHQEAVVIVNAIAQVIKKEIPKIMNVDNVTILSEAKLTDQPDPVSLSIFIKVLIAFIFSLMSSIGIVFLLEYLDDTLKSEKDVREIFDKPTLSVISKMKKSDLNQHVEHPNKSRVGETVHASVNQ